MQRAAHRGDGSLFTTRMRQGCISPGTAVPRADRTGPVHHQPGPCPTTPHGLLQRRPPLSRFGCALPLVLNGFFEFSLDCTVCVFVVLFCFTLTSDRCTVFFFFFFCFCFCFCFFLLLLICFCFSVYIFFVYFFLCPNLLTLLLLIFPLLLSSSSCCSS